MKIKVVVTIIFIVLMLRNIYGQVKNLSLAAGYFGEVITYPGLVAEIEKEKIFLNKLSSFTRIDLGFYTHPRSHNAVFLDFNRGFRRYAGNGLFFEQSIGVGTLTSFYNEEVWHIDDKGNAIKVSRFGNFSFMPSVTLGIGYSFRNSMERQKLIWLRPKIFWQIPYNNSALPHLALQVGYTFTLKTNEKK